LIRPREFFEQTTRRELQGKSSPFLYFSSTSSTEIREEISRQLALLPLDKEQQVLNFVRFLRKQERAQATSGHTLRHLRGLIPADQLQEMAEAIEDECEGVELEGWE
jgi:hypothetical protein